MLCEFILMMSIEIYGTMNHGILAKLSEPNGTRHCFPCIGKHSSSHMPTFFIECCRSEILPTAASNSGNLRITGQIQIHWENQKTSPEDETKTRIKQKLGSFMPTIFAHAVMIDAKQKKTHIDGQDEVTNGIKGKRQKPRGKKNLILEKITCKYRKSCYQTGKIPEITKTSFSWNYWLPSMSQPKESNSEQKTHSDTHNNEIDSKIKCKYRLSCYTHNKLTMEKNDEQRTLLMGKALPLSGKKKTLKEIAEKTMIKLKAAEEKAASRPIPKSIKIEKQINAAEEQLNVKLLCKYRKSCYKSGMTLSSDESVLLPITSTTQPPHKLLDVASYNELKQLEKKIYCKYRKSCYESGIKPEIEPEIQIHSFRDLAIIPQVIETRKKTYQEQCKYRKSCYETGIAPQQDIPQENNIQKEINSVIPSSVRELKTLCRYRKSCYAEIAQTATVETINTIRKRRLKEKEANKRKMRREKHRRRLRWNTSSKSSRRLIKKELPIVSSNQEYINSKRNKDPSARKNEALPTFNTTENINNTTLLVDEKKHTSTKRKVTRNQQENQGVNIDNDEIVLANRRKKEETINMPVQHKNQISKKSIVKPKKVIPKVSLTENDKNKRSDNTSYHNPESKKTNAPENIKSDGIITPPPQNEKKGKPKSISKKRKARQYSSENDELTKNSNNQNQHSDFCKYRKSCYSSGEKPVIAQSFFTLYNSFNEHVDKSYDIEDITTRSGTSKKLECKYRKSCYNDDIKQEMLDNEKKRIEKPPIHRKVKTKQSEPTDRKIHQESRPVIFNSENVSHDYTNDSDLSVNEKLTCRYRKSCYTSSKLHDLKTHSSLTYKVPRMPVKATKCNKYYISCQEILGLPTKQKVPIGPNGKRLCSKKKPQ